MRNVNLDAAASVFADDPAVEAAWAFGSVVSGRNVAGSDVDLAVLCKQGIALEALCDLRARLQRALGLDDVDLTVLNTAGVLLRFEAMSGRLLFVRDREHMATFQSLTAREYEDELGFQQRRLVA